MSSPPSHPSPLSMPKRPTFATTPSAQGAPRRTSSLHPLRQTSFPVEDSGAARVFSAASARSETGSIGAGSLKSISLSGRSPAPGSITGTVTGRGRGRPRKDRTKDAADKASAKSVGSAAGTGEKRKRGATPGSAVAGGGADAAEEDEGDDVADGGEIKSFGNLAREMEAKNLNVLMQAMDADQSSRYSTMRRVKLKKETVRKQTNQIVSQSVPQPIIVNVSGFSKIFAGEIVELAKQIQAEYAAAWSFPSPPASSPDTNDTAISTIPPMNPLRPSSYNQTTGPVPNMSNPHPSNSPTREPQPTHNPYTNPPLPQQQQIPNPNSWPRQPHPNPNHPLNRRPGIPYRAGSPLEANPHEGPLLPAHIREALRRSRRNGEGGGTGFAGLSLDGMGIRGDASWRVGGGMGAKRLFG